MPPRLRRAFGGDVVAAFGIERNGMAELPGERRGPGAGRQDQFAGLDCTGFMPQDEAAGRRTDSMFSMRARSVSPPASP